MNRSPRTSRDVSSSMVSLASDRSRCVNHPLARALRGVGVDAVDVAARLGVDPKTVGRWLTEDRIPHARHRLGAAEARRRDVSDIWPDTSRRRDPIWFRPWQEIERERARLDKERQHYANALAALHAKGDMEGIAQLQERLAQIDTAIQDVDYRSANVRAGYVYVISNVGAFGERMVKIGMTRRLEPMDRVRELGDASVPFRFDVHALIFSDDAVGLENSLHQEFADRRVNQVNLRREFFYATPGEVRTALERIAGNHLLEYNEIPEALEYRAGKPA